MCDTRKYKVVKTYHSPYPDSIFFHKNDMVEIGEEFNSDSKWKNWIWCKGINNNEAWILKQYLNIVGKQGTINTDYNARELDVLVGDELSGHELINGFVMAEKMNSDKGWVPLKNLILMN